MSSRTAITAGAVVLAATYPLWSALPVATGLVPLQVISWLIVYLIEAALMTVVVIAVIEGRALAVLAGAAGGLLIGVIPGVAIFPVSLFLPSWLKAVAPAMVSGTLINRGVKSGRSFAVGAFLAALFLLVIYIQGKAALGEQVSGVNTVIENIISGQGAAGGYNREAVNSLIDQVLFIMKIVVRLLPGLFVISGIAQLFMAFMVTEWYFTRRDSFFPGFGPFIYWKIPEKMLYFLGLVLIARLTISGTVQLAADNLLFVFLIFYAVSGLALIEYALRRLRLPTPMKIIFYIGLGLMHVMGLIAAAIAGLFDSYFDFRKVRAHTLG